MSQSSLLGGVAVDEFAPGHDIEALGPSDSTDSGSDIAGAMPTTTDTDGLLPVDRPWLPSGTSDSDRSGTGERASSDGVDPMVGADILPDRVVGAADAGVVMDDDMSDEVDPDRPAGELPDDDGAAPPHAPHGGMSNRSVRA